MMSAETHIRLLRVLRSSELQKSSRVGTMPSVTLECNYVKNENYLNEMVIRNVQILGLLKF